jgi:hypothetical protein
MIEGIAQELFFHDNELNFYDADSLKWFEEWATANNDLFEEERARWGVKNVANFFTEQNFGYTGLICDNRGCRDFVSSYRCLRFEKFWVAFFLDSHHSMTVHLLILHVLMLLIVAIARER